MSGVASSGSGLFKFLNPRKRIQSNDLQAAATWGIAATTTAVWLIQPFDWLRKTFLENSDPEKK